MNDTTEYANSIFEQPWWLDIVAPGHWQEIWSKDKAGNVLARMVIVKSGRKIYMPKLTQTLGVWMQDSIRNDYGAEKRIYLDLFEQIKEYKRVLIHLSPENRYVLPFRWAGYTIEPKFTYRITDLTDLDALYSGFNKTAKKNIKSARNKVTISDELDVQELWEMLNKTFEVQNRKNPMSKELVFYIVEECEKRGSGKYYSAKDREGNVHSCAYFVYDEKVCYYLLGATDSKYRSSGAQSLVLWEGIQFASQHSRVFDFEGSMVEGIENFFRQFNSQCTTYYEVRKQSIISEMMLQLKPKIKKLIGYKV